MRRQPAREAQLTRLRSARDLIDRAVGEPLDVPALARHAGYSRFHFIRAFRAAYGETPAQYLSRRRIERACDLLTLANLTVREVSELVGFTSLAAFSMRFRIRVGASPTEYRRQIVGRGKPPVPGYVLMWARQHPSADKSAIPTKPVPSPRTTVASKD